MNILFFPFPLPGHLLPQLPLARAFRRQGHHVAFASGVDMRSYAEREGFAFLPFGMNAEESLAETVRRTGNNPSESMLPEGVAELFAGVRIDFSFDEIIGAAGRWAPDLIVNDYLEHVGPLVAATLSIPAAALAQGACLPSVFVDAMTDVMTSRYTDRGLPAPAGSPGSRWLLDLCPPSLQLDGSQAAVPRIPLRPETHQAPGYTWRPERTDTGRPRVLVSFGTFYTYPSFLAELLMSLRTLDADIVLAVKEGDRPADFGIEPGEVELTPFVPMLQLLEGVSAVVHHGGAGNTFGTLAQGLPSVVVPQGVDQIMMADKVSRLGAGVGFPLGHADVGAVTAAVRRVLSEPGFTDAAQRVRKEIDAMPSAAEVAEWLASAAAGAARP